jgi:hypothetical protein
MRAPFPRSRGPAPGVVCVAASTTRHETRALLRAHLAAASGYGHLTRRCGICHRLQRLAMEPAPASAPEWAYAPGEATDTDEEE